MSITLCHWKVTLQNQFCHPFVRQLIQSYTHQDILFLYFAFVLHQYFFILLYIYILYIYIFENELEFVKSDRRIAKISESPVIQKYDFSFSSSGIKKYASFLFSISQPQEYLFLTLSHRINSRLRKCITAKFRPVAWIYLLNLFKVTCSSKLINFPQFS